MTTAVHIENLAVAYREQFVLHDVSVQIPKGTLTAIVGPNGAGKSTLLKSILGLIPIVEGKIEIFDQPYKKIRAKVGYVPQRSSVDWDFPTNALDVVLMGMYKEIGWLRVPKAKDKQKAMLALEQMGMSAYANRQISQLSGGQQQRVFLARALVQQADLYILDEPLAGVDAVTEKMIMATLRELMKAGSTILVVHHDLQTVEEYFDHVLLLNRKVIQFGATNDVFQTEWINRTYHEDAVKSGDR